MSALPRRLLQITVGIGGFVPVLAGLYGMIAGSRMIGNHPDTIAFDSHARYLSGLLFAIGLGFWSTIPRIETKTEIFRLLTAIVFIGGLSRLAGIFMTGNPGPAMLFGLGMELIVTPALCVCVWQSRIKYD
jgi:hypothetical protein